METRVLVTVASKHGATTELARAIAEVLNAAGIETAVVPPEAVTSLEGYDAVVLGSGVYAGRWLGPAREFAERFRAALVDRPVWLFSSGPIGDQPGAEQEALDVAHVREITRARDHRIFAGKVDRSQLSFVERAIFTVVRAPEGDFRPWDDVLGWGREIAATLAKPPVGSPTPEQTTAPA